MIFGCAEKRILGCAVASTSSATAEGKICGKGRILAKKICGFLILHAQRITTSTAKRFVCQYITLDCYKARASREYKKAVPFCFLPLFSDITVMHRHQFYTKILFDQIKNCIFAHSKPNCFANHIIIIWQRRLLSWTKTTSDG